MHPAAALQPCYSSHIKCYPGTYITYLPSKHQTALCSHSAIVQLAVLQIVESKYEACILHELVAPALRVLSMHATSVQDTLAVTFQAYKSLSGTNVGRFHLSRCGVHLQLISSLQMTLQMCMYIQLHPHACPVRFQAYTG